MAQSQGLSPLAIIDRDIEFYTAMAHYHHKELQKAPEGCKNDHYDRWVRAQNIYQSIIQYKASLKSGAIDARR